MKIELVSDEHGMSSRCMLSGKTNRKCLQDACIDRTYSGKPFFKVLLYDHWNFV
jgi:hypothetical protein